MKNFYVYMYLRSNASKNGPQDSPYYVGKGIGGRAFDKNHRCKPPVDKAKIIFVSTEMYEHDAHQLEMFLIHTYGRIDIGTGCLGNLTDGGEGKHGHVPSAESRAKQSEWMKAHPNRGNELCPKWPKGKSRTAEMNAKQSASWTPELREQMAAKHRGKKQSPERAEKSRQAHLGIKDSKETKQRKAAALEASWATGERHVALEEVMRRREEETGMSAIERRRKRKREEYALRVQNDPTFAAKNAACVLARYHKKQALKKAAKAEREAKVVQ